MNRIRLLPDHVANQIAAGEVVERPASVVKELVENALDAQAGRIQVEIGAGGRSLVRVSDDGIGMSRDDALLSLERHATSKIRVAEDLAAVQTMGFRGEALPSIASVSRFVLTTREREDSSGDGTQIVVNGGRIAEVKSAASPGGTTIEVRQLFFNLPARRKFLRSEDTERAHIQHYLTLAALAHPEVAFAFVSDQRPVWQLPPQRGEGAAGRSAALRERFRSLIGGDIPLLPVDFSADLEESGEPESEPGMPGPVLREGKFSRFRLWGFIGAPGVSRGSRAEQFLFVNRRPVENRGLNHALVEGYHTALMKGRYPVCCLFLEIDPAAVDVNVHPAKREVKFREEWAVRRLVARAVREALVAFHARAPGGSPIAAPANPEPAGSAPAPAPLLGAPLEPPSAAPRQAALGLGFRPAEPRPAPPVPRELPPPPPVRPGATPQTTARPGPGIHAPVPEAVHPTVEPVPVGSSGQAEPANGVPSTLPAPSPTGLPPVVPLLQVPLRVIGVVGRLYVLLESDRGLVLMDQHAAHERILFEQMMNRLESASEAPAQRLLLPETIELAPRDAEFLRRHLETLSRLGVGLREFGDRTFLLDSLPPFVKVAQPRQFAVDLVDALKAAGAGVNTLRLGEDVVAKTVCRHSVKANDTLGLSALQQLVNDLRRCAMPYTCPHGRPTLIEMPWRELERKFGRVA